MKKQLVVALFACALVLFSACAPRDPVPSTELIPHTRAHDEPSLETLLAEEPYASLFPAAVADRYEMESSVRMLYDPVLAPNPYGWDGSANLRTEWSARVGLFHSEIGTMEIAIEMSPKYGERTVEASSLTLEALRPHTRKYGKNAIAVNVSVHCPLNGMDYYVNFTGHHNDMSEEELYRIITSAKVFQN
ncbi:MAG: hypothetical protein IJL66_01250 [Lachnospiraceae bacterium]|nr:hypothetical protein [Lachnospiraceae bacterium]